MATYADAKLANSLIKDIAQANNSILSTLARIMSIRAQFVALNATRQDEIRAAVNDQGYSSTEIEAIVTKWNAVNTTKDAEGLVVLDAP